MSRHRSPAGRHPHPQVVPPTAATTGAWPRREPDDPYGVVALLTRPDASPTAAAVPAGPISDGPISPYRSVVADRGRHVAAPAVRNGLTAAAATAGVLALAVPAFALVSTVEPTPDAPTALGLAAQSAEAADLLPGIPAGAVPIAAFELVDTTPEAGPVLGTGAVSSAGTTIEAVAPALDAAGLLKAVGLVEIARQAEEARLAREAAAQCDAPLRGLGSVKPWVRDAARFLACLYEQPSLIGVAGRARVSDHPRGLAVDLMVRGEQGDRIAECALANKDALGVSYVIWEQRVNYGDGWERMDDRGSDTENHFDHVHVSFERGAGSGDPIAALCT